MNYQQMNNMNQMGMGGMPQMNNMGMNQMNMMGIGRGNGGMNNMGMGGMNNMNNMNMGMSQMTTNYVPMKTNRAAPNKQPLAMNGVTTVSNAANLFSDFKIQ